MRHLHYAILIVNLLSFLLTLFHLHGTNLAILISFDTWLFTQHEKLARQRKIVNKRLQQIVKGCSQAFCTKHYSEHRRTLSEEMNEIISEQNQLQLTFNEQSTEPDSHPFMKRINEWEKDAIDQIQKRANELRLEVIELTAIRRGELSNKLRQMSTQLTESRQNDNYIEIDLQQWKNTLKDLQSMLDLSTMFSFEEPANTPLLQNISLMFTVENELFEQTFDNAAQIRHNGRIVLHDTSYNYTEIRGKNEYTSGCHKIRLHFEQSADSWTFFGN